MADAWASASAPVTTPISKSDPLDVVVAVEVFFSLFGRGCVYPIPLRVVGKIVNKRDAKIPAPSGKLIMT